MPMNIMSKKSIVISLFVAAVASVAALYFLNQSTEKNADLSSLQPKSDPDIVRIGYPVLRIALPVFVAKEKGFFDKHRVNVELVRYDTAQPMMDALVSGSLDVGGYCALPITFSAMARSKTPLIFISSMMEDDQHPISILIVKKGMGLNSVKDLSGKRIGILPTRAYELWLKQILIANGVDPLSVVIQQIPPPQQTTALASGSVDALFTNDPAATSAQELGAGDNLAPGRALVPEVVGLKSFYFGSFNITKSFADQHPDLVRRISLALDDAIDFMNQHPDEAKKMMAPYLPQEQQGLIVKFPVSRYRKTNETSHADLEYIHAYYTKSQILTAKIDINGAQYQRRD
jgi:NitT/TauT family transport system substrate-binding protein